MIFLAAILLSPWLHRVRRAPLAERVHRTETLFWLFVSAAGVAILTAGLLQVTRPSPVSPWTRPPVAGRA